MDRFQEMQVFVRIAERQSFTQATEDLRIPRAMDGAGSIDAAARETAAPEVVR